MSTTKVEYMTIIQACKEVIWIQRLMEELDTNNIRLLCIVIVRVSCTL